MARTIKQKPYRPYAKEDKENRHATHIKYRAKTRNVMAKGDYDAILPFKGTSGWETH